MCLALHPLRVSLAPLLVGMAMHPLQVMMRTASARPRLCRLWSQREATVVEAAVIGAEEQCR